MNIHYFQRYHSKENVATANTMLLLSRLYQYSSQKFFCFLKQSLCPSPFDPEISFKLQDKGKDSIPDAAISQESFRIEIETKLDSKHFDLEQLKNHLNAFNDEHFKLLLTLAPGDMPSDTKNALEDCINDLNEKTIQNHKDSKITHYNTTFTKIAEDIKSVLDDKDYDMMEVYKDYLEYCYHDKLIDAPDAWKTLRVQLSGLTMDFNLRNNMYFDTIDRGFRPHDYLGLYSKKRVSAIGRIIAQVIFEKDKDGSLKPKFEKGKNSKEIIDKINNAEKELGLNLAKTRFFFVDKFYETNFIKTSHGAPFGSRVFNIEEILGIKKSMKDTKEIAKMLDGKTWE